MRIPEVLEWRRVIDGPMASSNGELEGAFVAMGPCAEKLVLVASSGMGWDHVSVSTVRRVPNWKEMHWVKRLFWSDDEAVMQLHPPQSEYVDCCPNCLHLWRPNDGREIPLPEAWMVGPKQ